MDEMEEPIPVEPVDDVAAEVGEAPAEPETLPVQESTDSISENKDSDVLDLPAEIIANLGKQIDRDWEAADGSRTEWMNQKAEGLRLYWGIIRAKDFPFKGCANLHVPLIRTIADTLHSNVMGSINMEKPASVVPVGAEDVPKARKAEKLLNWQFTAQVDYPDLVDKIVNTTLIFGHCPVKTRYVVEKSNGEKRFDGIRCDVITPERFLMPPDARDADVQEMDYVMQEIPMTRSDLLKRASAGMYNLTKEDLDKLPAGTESKTDREAEMALERIREVKSGVNPEPMRGKNKRYFTLIEWHGSFDTDDDGIESRLMVSYLKEAKKVLRVVLQKRKRPFTIVRFSQILDRAVGESVPDLLMHVNQELNTLHNQRVDAVTIANIPYFFFDPAAGYDPNKVTLVPGMGIPVQGSPSQAVYFPPTNGVRPEMYQEEDRLFQYGERLLGAGSHTQGVMETKRTTATEIAATDRRAGIRFLTIYNRIKKGLREIMNIALELDKENMPAELQVRIIGFDESAPLFETIKREDLDAKVDIVINGRSVIDEQADKQDAMTAYQLAMMNPLVMSDQNAIYEVSRDTFVTLGIKKVDSYLRKPEDTIPKNPNEEHNLFLQEETVKPNVAENIEDHLKKHAEFITSDKFRLLSPKGQALAMAHYKDTVRMDAILKQLALVQQAQAVAAMQMAPGAGLMPPVPGQTPNGGPNGPTPPGGMAAPPRPGPKPLS